MEKEMGDLLHCVSRHLDHADFTTFLFEPSFARFGKRRIISIEDGLRKIFEKLLKIKKLSEKTNNQELLSILNEQEEILPVHD